MSETVIIPSLTTGDRTRNCAACRDWSRWLETTGDCMRYARLRRESMVGPDYTDTPPQRSARCTSAGYVCDDFTPSEQEPRP